MTFFNKRAIEYAEANKPKKVEKKLVETKVQVKETSSGSSETTTEAVNNSWLSYIGETCSANTDCKDFVSGGTDCNVKCCNGTCEHIRKDYVGGYYCPEVCKGGLFQAAGTCDDRFQQWNAEWSN